MSGFPPTRAPKASWRWVWRTDSLARASTRAPTRDAWAAALAALFCRYCRRADRSCRGKHHRAWPTPSPNTRPSLAIGGDGAGGHSNGVNALTAITALNHLAGNLGYRGRTDLQSGSRRGGGRGYPRQASYRSMLALAEDARQGRIQVLDRERGQSGVCSMPAAAGIKEALAADSADRQPVQFHGRDYRHGRPDPARATHTWRAGATISPNPASDSGPVRYRSPWSRRFTIPAPQATRSWRLRRP